MLTRAPAAGITVGMNVFFTGKIWEMQPEGRVISMAGNHKQVSEPALQKGCITNLWFKL
jgi:hypothetical protein